MNWVFSFEFQNNQGSHRNKGRVDPYHSWILHLWICLLRNTYFNCKLNTGSTCLVISRHVQSSQNLESLYPQAASWGRARRRSAFFFQLLHGDGQSMGIARGSAVCCSQSQLWGQLDRGRIPTPSLLREAASSKSLVNCFRMCVCVCVCVVFWTLWNLVDSLFRCCKENGNSRDVFILWFKMIIYVKKDYNLCKIHLYVPIHLFF